MATTHTRTSEAKFEIARRKANKSGKKFTPARNEEFRQMTGKDLKALAGTPAKLAKEVKVAVKVSTKNADKLKAKAQKAFDKEFKTKGLRAAFQAYKTVMTGAKA